MPNYVLSRTHDASGKEVGWALITVRDDFKIEGTLPAPRSTDYYFTDRTAALEALNKVLDGQKPEKSK